MFVSPITSVSMTGKLCSAKNLKPNKTELAAAINKCWKMLNENPLSIVCYEKLKDAEALLQKNYPYEYIKYINKFKLR